MKRIQIRGEKRRIKPIGIIILVEYTYAPNYCKRYPDERPEYEFPNDLFPENRNPESIFPIAFYVGT